MLKTDYVLPLEPVARADGGINIVDANLQVIWETPATGHDYIHDQAVIPDDQWKLAQEWAAAPLELAKMRAHVHPLAYRALVAEADATLYKEHARTAGNLYHKSNRYKAERDALFQAVIRVRQWARDNDFPVDHPLFTDTQMAIENIGDPSC